MFFNFVVMASKDSQSLCCRDIATDKRGKMLDYRSNLIYTGELVPEIDADKRKWVFPNRK